MHTWKTLSRQTILAHSKFLTVENHAVELPDGRVISDWPWVVTPEYINVAAVTTEGKFLCFRQPKYSVEGITLAPVGGYLEPGEEPLTTAQRELLEETGYEAPIWELLGSFPVDGNRGCGVAHFFFAHDARQVAEIHADDLEEHQMLHLTRTELETAITNGEFKLLPWVTVMVLALRHLDARSSHQMSDSFTFREAV